MNKYSANRILSALFSAVLLATSFVACSSPSDAPIETSITTAPEVGTEPVETEPMDSLDARQLIPDGLPEMNYDGTDFRILSYNSTENYIETPEEQTGDLVVDAVYERNRNIEERFGIKINVNKSGTHREAGATLEKLVQSGEDSYELYAGHAIVSGGSAINNMFLNWNSIDHVNFSQPWWNQNSVEALTLNGCLYLVPTYFTSSVISSTYCMYYNKKIAENNNLPNIYDTVNEGNWTLEAMRNMVTDVYQDINGNSEVDDGDAYGLAISSLSAAVTFTWAFDMDILSIDEDYNVSITFANERNAKIYEELLKLYTETVGVTTHTTDQDHGINIFVKGNTLLAAGIFQGAYSTLRTFEDDYAIIPYPKYDDQQKEYYSMLDGAHAVIGVPKTATKTEMIGIITEAMTADSWKTVIPNYYDVALKTKGTRDEQSVEMLDLIMDAVVVDFTYIYDNWQGYAFTLQDMLKAKSSNFASTVERQQKSKLRWYEKVVDAFVKNSEE